MGSHITQQRPCHNGSLQRKKVTLLAHQLGTCHHPHSGAAAHPSLLTFCCSHHGGQKPQPCLLSPTTPQVVLTLGKRTFIVSYLEPPSQLHTAAPAAGTESRQPVSKNTAPPKSTATPLAPGPWPPGLGAGERELATFILARILQVPSPRHGFDSATQEECVFPWDTETCFHKSSHWGLLGMERCLWFG